MYVINDEEYIKVTGIVPRATRDMALGDRITAAAEATAMAVLPAKYM